jgi:hypothetical protein
MRLLLTLSLFSFVLCAAEMPSRWRFEYHGGKMTTVYKEEQDSILFEDTNVTQKSAHQEFKFQYFLVPPWIDLSFGALVTGYQVDEPDDPNEQFTYITGYGNIGFVIPWGDFFQLKLVFEHFYTTMLVKDDRFGFQNLRGNQIYPEFDFLPFGSDMFLQIQPYFKTAIFSDVAFRNETTIGLKLKIPWNGPENQTFPTFAYQKALIIKLFYTQMNLKFERDNFIESDIDVQQYGATLGFSF